MSRVERLLFFLFVIFGTFAIVLNTVVSSDITYMTGLGCMFIMVSFVSPVVSASKLKLTRSSPIAPCYIKVFIPVTVTAAELFCFILIAVAGVFSTNLPIHMITATASIICAAIFFILMLTASSFSTYFIGFALIGAGTSFFSDFIFNIIKKFSVGNGKACGLFLGATAFIFIVMLLISAHCYKTDKYTVLKNNAVINEILDIKI